MADQSLVENKLSASKLLVSQLIDERFPLAAAYWERREERGGWVLLLIPSSYQYERSLIDRVSSLLVGKPFRSIFSLSDVFVESQMIERARALGAYIRDEDYVGRLIDTTFTAGHYFESVIPIYFAPPLLKHVRVS